jgi:arsenate reductase
MAEGLLRAKARPEAFTAFSAGISVKQEVNPMAIQVMNEIGVDISRQKPTDVAAYIRESFDWVVTVGDKAREKCPIFPGARFQHWDVPEAVSLESFRAMRDDLSGRIDAFLKEIDIGQPAMK